VRFHLSVLLSRQGHILLHENQEIGDVRLVPGAYAQMLEHAAETMARHIADDVAASHVVDVRAQFSLEVQVRSV